MKRSARHNKTPIATYFTKPEFIGAFPFVFAGYLQLFWKHMAGKQSTNQRPWAIFVGSLRDRNLRLRKIPSSPRLFLTKFKMQICTIRWHRVAGLLIHFAVNAYLNGNRGRFECWFGGASEDALIWFLFVVVSHIQLSWCEPPFLLCTIGESDWKWILRLLESNPVHDLKFRVMWWTKHPGWTIFKMKANIRSPL